MTNAAQIRIALHRRGILSTFANAAAALSGETWLAWENAPSFDADSPTLARIAEQARLSPDALASIIAEAEQIEV